MTIIVQNADFEEVSKHIIYGFDETLIFIGRNESTINHNYAIAEATLAKVGTVTYVDGAIFKNLANYVNTDIPDTKSYTVLAIAKNKSLGPVSIFSNYSNKSDDGFSGLLFRTDKTAWLCGSDGSTAQAAIVNDLNRDEWQFLAGSFDDDNSNSQLFNLKTGSNSGKRSTNKRTQTTRKYRIGSSYSGDGSNDIEVFMICFIPSAISKIAIDVIAEKMRAYAKKYGVDV